MLFRVALEGWLASFHGRGEAAVRVHARAVFDEDFLASHGDTLLLLSRGYAPVKVCSKLPMYEHNTRQTTLGTDRDQLQVSS